VEIGTPTSDVVAIRKVIVYRPQLVGGQETVRLRESAGVIRKELNELEVN